MLRSRGRRYLLESIHAVYKLISWMIRPEDSAIRNVISRHEPHWIRTKHTIDQRGRVAVSFKYWQLHFTGRHRYSYRRFLSRTANRYSFSSSPLPSSPLLSSRRQLHCRGCALSFVREVAHFCANVHACRSDFMITFGRLPNRRANMTCTILYSPSPASSPSQPHFPIFRSLDRIFCLLVDLREFICTLSARCRENVSRACREICRVCAH